MAYIVQKASTINTSAGASATAVFEKPLTPGNCIIVAAVAVDHGAEIGAGGFGEPGGSFAEISDSQGNFYNALSGNEGPYAWGWDGTFASQGKKSLWAGQYIAFPNPIYNGGTPSGLPGGADSVTFQFTPVSSAGNCHVGVMAFEVFDFTGSFLLANDNDQPSVTIPIGSDLVSRWSGGNFPFGVLVIECGAAILTTSDISPLTAGSGDDNGDWTLDASATAQIGSAYSTLGFQHYFDTGSGNRSSTLKFGSVPTFVWAGVGFANLYEPASAFTEPPTDSGAPPFLGSVVIVDSAPSGRSNPYWGTVQVLDSAPTNIPFVPYLGKVVVGTPSGSQLNPTLGKVTVLDAAPAGAPDIFLGTVEEQS